MKTKLVFPAFWTCSAPYLSVPSLVAFLEKYGKDVEQIDLNLEFTDYMLSREFLDYCLKKYERIAEENDKQFVPYLNEIGKFVCDHIDEQKSIMRTERALDILVYEKCGYFMAMGFSLINAAFPRETVSHYAYESVYNSDSFSSILKSAQDAFNGTAENLIGLLTSHFIDDLIEGTDLIGISLTGTNQIIPSFVLAGMIKKKNPGIKIVLGGSVPTRWFADKSNLPNIFEYVDYVIVNEGELALLALVNYLEGRCSLAEVPQLFYLNENNEIVDNELPVSIPELCSLPTPVFNKADLKRYFSPVPTLPLLGCRGCYWCKCTFCDHSFVYNNNYRPAIVDKVVLDIINYIREYDVKHINFHDEAMTPRGLVELSKKLLEKDVRIKWSTDARLDRGLTYDVLSLAHEAGLSILFFGLESINPRVISLMKKGTHIDVSKRILYDAKQVGIGSHCFFICGFPTETLEEYQETVEFVKANKDIIACQGCSVFSLGKNSPIARCPEKYELRILDKDDRDSASLNYQFERVNTNAVYEEKRKLAYQNVTKNLFAYAQKIFSVLFREHWVIYWDNIAETQQRANEVASRYPLKSGVFPIQTQSGILVFDCENSEVFEFAKETKYLFDLIAENGCKSIDGIVQKASVHYRMPANEMKPALIDFISTLIEKKLVFTSGKHME